MTHALLSCAILLVVLHHAHSAANAALLSDLGSNYGANFRLNIKGLQYVADKAMDGYYKYCVNIPQFDPTIPWPGLLLINWGLQEMCKPTFNISFGEYGINRYDQDYYAEVTDFKCDKIKVAGDYNVYDLQMKEDPSKAGTFSFTVTNIKNQRIFIGTRLKERKGIQSFLKIYVRDYSLPEGTVDVEITGNDDNATLREYIKKSLTWQGQRTTKDFFHLDYSLFKNAVYDRIVGLLKNNSAFLEVQDPRLRVFYWILKAPNFTETSVDTQFWGETTWKRYLSKAPKGNLTWPHVPEAETKMVTIQLTDYIMNSIGYLMYNDNALSFNITREQIPPSARDMLSFSDCTNCAGDMFPWRKEKNAGGSMEVRIKASSPPRLVLETDDQPVVSFKGHFEGYVAMPGERWPQQILTVDAELSLPLELSVVDNNIVGKILVNETKFVKVDREYPRPSVDVNMEIFQELVKVGFIGPLNGIFQKGFPLPMYNGTSCVNPEVFVKSNLIMVSTDLAIDPALLQ